ncbi:hypothetical protein RQP46_000482 [Phenoliferia psychrophenolica]
MDRPLGAPPTPSSELLTCISSFTDVLDSLPPELTRSLSDLRELDAVLSGSLQSITSKLEVLLTMMNSPRPGSTEEADAPKFTPLQRLQILREVTEDAKVFRLGGEDKVRVASGTCETIATHTSHLSSLSSLLLSFLPPDLLQTLPPPSAPHGYPSSSTPSSSQARRQAFDYPPTAFPGNGHVSRLHATAGSREHLDHSSRASAVTRAPTVKKRSQQHGLGQGQVAYHGGTDTEFNFGGYAAVGKPMSGAGTSGGGDRQPTQKELKERDPNHRHPNQYTKKKLQVGTGAAAGSVAMGAGESSASGAGQPAASSRAAQALDYASGGGGGASSTESTKARRGAESTAAPTSSGAASRAGGASGAAGQLYAGMASREEYASATAGGRATQKRKTDDTAVATKRRKTTRPDVSPEPTPAAQTAPLSGIKSLRRAAAKADDSPLPTTEDDAGDDGADDGDEADGDGATYCICNQVSFGEMIGCDGESCEREWVRSFLLDLADDLRAAF